jgi:tetratricopeptide (TPR) repeat protein
VHCIRTLSILIAVSLAAAAADPPKSTEPQSDADKFVRNLGSAVFAEREKASRDLWKLGAAARPALEKAANSDDPEVAKRASDILEKFSWGIFPDTPASVLKQIKEFRSNDWNRQSESLIALVNLESRGVETIGLLLAQVTDPERRSALFGEYHVLSRDRVPLLMERGEWSKAEAFLTIGACGPNPEAWLDYADFMVRRGRTLPEMEFLTAVAKLTGDRGNAAAGALAVLEHRIGKTGDATKRLRAIPAASRPPHLLPSMLEDARLWSELAADPDPEEGPPNPGLNLFRARKGGRNARAVELLADLKRTGTEGDRDSAAEAGLSLFLNGFPLDGIAVLKEKKAHPRLLADVYAGRLMFPEVFAVLGDGPLAKELEDEDQSRDRAYYDMRKARVFAQIGRKDDAVQLFHRIAPGGRPRDHYLIRELLRAELRCGYFDLACEHAGTTIESIDRTGDLFSAQPEPFELLFDDDAEAARELWIAFRQTAPTNAESPGATMRRIRRLLVGVANEAERTTARAVLDNYSAAKDIPRSLSSRVREHRARAALARREAKWEEVEKHLREAVRLWSFDSEMRLRTPGEIREQAVASSNGPRAWLFSTNETFKIAMDLGEFLMERNRPAEAAKVFRNCWKQYPNNPIPLYLAGRALLLAGETTEGRRQINLAHAVALGDAQFRGRFVHELCERGHLSDVRTARDDAARYAWFWTPYRGNVWNAMARASYILKDFEPSAEAIERNLHFLLKTPNVVFVDGIGYISVPANVRANRARAQLAAGRIDAAFAEAKAILQLLPGQTEFLTAIVPEFEKAGRKTEADALFAFTWGSLEKLRKEYPDSAWIPATMAFAAAGCRRESEAALKCAKFAFEREPEIRWHREVLAEVRFRRGERVEAIKLAEELQKLDHRSAYYRRLLERYRTGEFTSALPLAPEDD